MLYNMHDKRGKWRVMKKKNPFRALPEENRRLLMDTIYGESTTYDRVAKDTMTPNNSVAIDHDYYSANPEAASKKMKEVNALRNDTYGQELGYHGKMGPKGYNQKKEYEEPKRVKKAIGGVMKVRRGYEGTSS